MKTIKYSLAVLPILLFTACSYSDSALQYATEGSKRAEAGYTAKIEMTKHLTAYLAEANKGCGVTVEKSTGNVIVKECVRPSELLATVDKVEIIKPQQVKDMLDSMGDFAMKATNLAVPVASIYYGFKNNEVNQNANVAIRQSDNAAQTSMWGNYTENYQNTTNTTDTSVSNTSTTTTNTTETTSIPSINVDTNTTTIN